MPSKGPMFYFVGLEVSGNLTLVAICIVIRIVIRIVIPISLDSCLCYEDVIKSKLVYTVLMRPKIRPKHMYAVT